MKDKAHIGYVIPHIKFGREFKNLNHKLDILIKKEEAKEVFYTGDIIQGLYKCSKDNVITKLEKLAD